MHQTRAETSKKIPIERKGTKYIVRSRIAPKNSVPVLIAVRDMLALARTAKEVTEMIKLKLLKINNREVKDYHESILLFNIFEADELYVLTLTQNGKFALKQTKHANERLSKIVSKTLVRGDKIQLNLHDGTNIISDNKKYSINDSLYIDFSNKIKRHVSFMKDAEAKVISGKYIGRDCKIEQVKEKKAMVKIGDKSTELNKSALILI